MSGSNCFGDKYYTLCRGCLVITDLRIIFLPQEIQLPQDTCASITASRTAAFTSSSTSTFASSLLALRRMTYVVPLSAVQEVRVSGVGSSASSFSTGPTAGGGGGSGSGSGGGSGGGGGGSGDINSAYLQIDSKDAATVEFCVRRVPLSLRRQAIATPLSSASALAASSAPVFNGGRIHNNTTESVPLSLSSRTGTGTGVPHAPAVTINYFSGLETHSMAPWLWCSRVLDEVMFLVREDRTWIRWCMYLKQTCEEQQQAVDAERGRDMDKNKDKNKDKSSHNHSSATPSSRQQQQQQHQQAIKQWQQWQRKARQRISVESEYSRLRVQDGEWLMSSLNCDYQLCETYPQTLVLPASLSDEDIRVAAGDRSKRRLCALTWLHPTSKVPLCRSSQPRAGMSGSNDADKTACVAIKTSCPTGMPLRIADARPKLNANANALQGKGFENVAAFGGAAVASITFLDIDNIHVMRSSLLRLREGWSAAAGNSAAPDNDCLLVSE